MPIMKSVWVQCDKCGRKSEPLPLMPEFPNAQRNYFYALGMGGWSVNRKENRVLCQACWINAYAEKNGIELPHNPVTSPSMKEEKEEE